jgi:hypothetical protein
MAVPGETACREVAPCAPGTWGDIPVDGSTEYVDGAYGGADSDGTAAHPWTAIQQGVDAAAPGAIVAIAEGSYNEEVVIQGKAVRLRGRCPKLVEVVGVARAIALSIESGASGADVRGVAVRGVEAVALAITGSENVVVDRVWIHDAGFRGLVVQNGLGATSFELTHSLVEGNREFGVLVSGSAGAVEATVVRDTQPRASDQTSGVGIFVQDDPDSSERASATVRGSDVEGNRLAGVTVLGSDTTIETTIVRETQAQASDQQGGAGVVIVDDQATGLRSTANVRDSVVERNRDIGIFVLGSDATIEATVVRETRPRASDQKSGAGIAIQDHPATGERATAIVRASVVEYNHEIGMVIGGSDATIEATVVRGTEPRASDQQRGSGIGVTDDAARGERASATVRASLVEGNRTSGVVIIASDATIDATVVRDTQAQASDGRFGDGVAVDSNGSQGASVTLTACLVAGSARAGVAAFGAPVALGQTRIECNTFHLAGEDELFASFSFDDIGGNACGCDGTEVVCQVASPGLEPPEPIAPTN